MREGPRALRLLAISAVLLLLGACLPPQRSNDPPADTGGTVDTGVDSGGEQDTGGAADTGTDPVDTGAGPVDTVDLPEGCTSDVFCQGTGKPTAQCKVWLCDKSTGKCNKPGNAKINTPCDDGDACTTGDKCNAGAQCIFGKKTDCDDKNPCTVDTCSTTSGGCQYANAVDVSCDDGDKCTGDDKGVDTCVAGKCASVKKVCTSTNPCQGSECNPKTGNCDPKKTDNSGKDCDDGDLCTVKDKCQKSGACIGAKNDCNDGQPCTNDACNPSFGCSHLTVVGTSQECQANGDLCVKAFCNSKGQCIKEPTAKAKACTTPNPCQTVKCDPGSGQCKYEDAAKGKACVDQKSKCFRGQCDSGTCLPDNDKDKAKVVCDDGNKCTNDSCKSTVGCVYTPNTLTCDDGSACTGQDTCKDGKCGGVAKACDDKEECTTDTCDPLTGSCKHANVADGTTCKAGKCKAGKCE